MATVSVDKFYKSVISEVIENMKEAVLEEGIDEQVLTELKMLWEQKLSSTKATDTKLTPSHFPIQPASSSGAIHKQTALNVMAPRAVPAMHAAQSIQMGATHVFRPTVRPHQNHALDMSGAASAATMALPQVYQQQILPGTIQLQQTSTGLAAVIPSSAIQAGNINLQQVQQVQPQNLSTKVQGQLDGALDMTETGSEEAGADNQTSKDHSCRPKTYTPRRRRKCKKFEVVLQLDGADGADTSSEDDDDIDDDDIDDDLENEGGDGEGEEESLNSGDDDDDDKDEEVDNVVVCQYDKITRSKNRWRFTLKDGIMNINQRDYVFHKANGEAEW